MAELFHFCCLKVVSLMVKQLEPRPDWSSLGVKFKISEEHSRHFYIGVPPRDRSIFSYLNVCLKELNVTIF